MLAFHITKGGYPGSIGGYPGSIGGYPGGYPGRYPGGYDTGIIGSVYPGTSYRGSSLIPGYGGYLGPGGLIGGGSDLIFITFFIYRMVFKEEEQYLFKI